MHSPMAKEGEYYILKIVVPDSISIDYLFQFNRKAGLFKITFSYLYVYEQPDRWVMYMLSKNEIDNFFEFLLHV